MSVIVFPWKNGVCEKAVLTTNTADTANKEKRE